MTNVNNQKFKHPYSSLKADLNLDNVDWHVVTHYATKWKMSVPDALLELSIVNETSLAQVLAASHGLICTPGANLQFDFSLVNLDNYNDLISVCAIPLENNLLAVCNPDDDHHGFLDKQLCEREMIVSERKAIFEALRDFALKGLDDNNSKD